MVLTGAQIIMECLLEQGVDTIFDYPGGAAVSYTHLRGIVVATLSTVTTTVVAILKIIEVAILRRTPCSSFAPNRCAVMTENPPVSPCTNPITKKEIAPVAPTAASACTLMVRPTIMASTIL